MDEDDFWDDEPHYDEPGDPDFDQCCNNGYRSDGTRCRWCNPTPRQRRRQPLVLLYEERHADAVQRQHARAYARGRVREPEWMPF